MLPDSPTSPLASTTDSSERSAFQGRTVLVTGGTGSFGGTFARRLLSLGVGQVRILSRDEAKQDDMRRQLQDPRASFHLGDVRSYRSVLDACDGVDYVFHAAALKQVPSCEFFPQQATETNVLGSDNVIRAAHASGVKGMVCLSTDKAVYPINAMGMSKALMEKTAQAFSRNHPDSQTVVSIVRYGNVMYSRGSVIPLFVEQISQGKSLTLTDPAMTRFLMSLAESVSLVEYALLNASPGDLYVRKSPAATVGDLAAAVAKLLNVDASFTTIGTRHGEKLFETLLAREEITRAEDHGAYFRVPLDGRGLNYQDFTDSGEARVSEAQDYTSHNTERLDVDAVAALVGSLPEMQAAISRYST